MTTNPLRSTILSAVLTGALAAASGTTPAEAARPAASNDGESPAVRQARERFKAGEAAFRVGDFERARSEFEAGYALVPRPGFLLNMAHSERRLGRLRNARSLYKKYLLADPESRQRDEVLGLIAKLDSAIADEEKASAQARADAAPATAAAPPTTPAPASTPAPVPASAPSSAPASAPTPAPGSAPAPARASAAAPAPAPATAPAPARPAADYAALGDVPASRAREAERTPAVTLRARAAAPAEREAPSPFYARWWFWGTMAAVALAAGAGAFLLTRDNPTYHDDGSLGRVGSP